METPEQQLASLSPEQRRLLEYWLRQEQADVIKAPQQIPRRHTTDAPPLSFAQQRLWFLNQLEPDSTAYHVRVVLRLIGRLDLTLFARSLDAILARHETLRTAIHSTNGQPRQVIAPRLHLALPLLDLGCLSPDERAAQIARLALQLTAQPFDLEHTPLVRARLLRLAAKEHVLLLVLHHIIADDWSQGILLRELTILYAAFLGNTPPALPALPIQYADYAIWQRQGAQAARREQQLAFWKAQLAAPLAQLELPSDRPRPLRPTHGGAVVYVTLPAVVLEALKGLSRRAGATLFMTLLAAFDVLLYRYTGQTDIVVGSPVAGRMRQELEGLIGLFVNLLVLRTNLEGDPSFGELLRRVRKVALEAYEHQDVPFEQVIDALRVARDVRRHPVFPVMVVLQNSPLPDLEGPGLRVVPVEIPTMTAALDLSLYMREIRAGLQMRVEYATDLFDAATIERMLNHFQVLLEEVVTDPDRRLSALPLLTAREREQLLVAWNVRHVAYPYDHSVPAVFAAQAACMPDTVALVFEGPMPNDQRPATSDQDRRSSPQPPTPNPHPPIPNTQHLTYRELNERANQLAHYLRSLGVGPETMVGIYVERSVAMVVGVLSVLKAGAAYVPLDPTYPKDRLAFMLADSQLRVVLTQDHLRDYFLSGLARTTSSLHERVVCLDTGWAVIAQESTQNLVLTLSPDQLAYVIYTSGSTGRPKGVLGLHRGILNRAHWMWQTYPFAVTDLCCHKTSLNFVDAVWELFGPLLQGIPLVLIPDDILKDAHQFVATLARTRVTHLVLVPSLLHALLKTYPNLAHHLPHLQSWTCSGEVLTGELARRFRSALPQARLLNLYGSSEVAADVTEYELLAEQNPHVVPIGRPIANTQIYLLDRFMQPVPIGVVGELYIGGAGLARGYLNRPELTAERFVPNPFGEVLGVGCWVLGEHSDTEAERSIGTQSSVLSPQSSLRLYRTGDRARYRLDGMIEFLGRLDKQVKLRGFRIELGEIEAALAQHPTVREGVVVARENVLGDTRLVAYVVLRTEAKGLSGVEVTINPYSVLSPQSSVLRELCAFLLERLPAYMIPAVFVQLDALPMTPSGKLDRSALPVPDVTRPELETTFVAPRTPVEEVVAGIWADVLGVAAIGVDDNFFALGGHSLLATQVIARLRNTLAVEVPLRVLFETPTAAALAARLAAEWQMATPPLPPITPLARPAALPLSFAQQRLWFLDQLQPGSATYIIPMSVRLTGALNLAAFSHSLDEIARRHETLRTSFTTLEGQPVQVIAPPTPQPLTVLDLQAVADDERTRVAEQLSTVEAQRPFDLAHGPLFRVALLRLAPQDHVILLTMHHIISDGWSIGVAIRELSALYSAFSTGRPPSLPELPIQYADFALWQRDPSHQEAFDAQLAYWRAQLPPNLPLLELPTAFPRPPLQSFLGARHQHILSPTLTTAVKAFSQHEGVTLFMTLLAAFQAVLARSSGQDHIVVGTPVAGRTRAELEGMIGFFLNTLPLHTDLSGNPTLRQLLQRVREVTLGAYAHQELPFERLLEELQPQRTLNRTPFVEVMFNLFNFASPALSLPGLAVETFSFSHQHPAKFDLTLYAQETGQTITLQLLYNVELFEAAQAVELLDHLHNMLEQFITDPELPLAAVPLLSQSQRRQRLSHATQVGPTNPFLPFEQAALEGSLADRFAQQVARYPDRIAVKTRQHELTYARLHQHAQQLARRLVSLRGPHPENIALLFEHDASMIVGLLAVLLASKTYVPLDPAYPRDRIAFILHDCQAGALLTNSANLALAKHLTNSTLPCITIDEQSGDLADETPLPLVSPDTLAYLLYTSGSAGRPKGVMQNHRNVLHHIRVYTNNLHIHAGDKLTLFSSYSFDAAVMDIFGALLNGATLYPLDIRTQTPQQLSEWLVSQAITIYHSTPTVYRYFLDMQPGQTTFPQIRLVVLGGEEVHKRDVELYRRHFSPECLLINGLGPTESTLTLQYFLDQQTTLNRYSVPVGYPVEDTQVLLLNRMGEQDALYGIGEICIRSPAIALGYWQRPETSQAAFLPDPDGGERRMYRSGDLGRWLPEGRLEFVGRADFQVKLNGYRIETGEIEARLCELSTITDAVVVAQQTASNERVLVAYLVLRTEGQGGSAAEVPLLTPHSSLLSEVRAYLQEQLPSYMLPAALVVLEELPRTPSGKLDRRALPALDSALRASAQAFVVPRTPLEEVVAGLWSQLLRVEHVSLSDNFFALGGHSLLAIQLLARLRDILAVELPLRALFEAPTVAELAERIERAQCAAMGVHTLPLSRVARTSAMPLSFAQQRLWFLDQLLPGTPIYNLPLALRLLEPLDVWALHQSLNALVERHETLRTTFAVRNGEPVQHIARSSPLALGWVDLRRLIAGEREGWTRRLLAEEARRPFDLARGPLLRALLLQLDTAEYVVLLMMHHIISDGWSLGVLVEELTTLYRAYRAGQSATLPALPLQYADFAHWQRQWLASGDGGQGSGVEVQREKGSGVFHLPSPIPQPPSPLEVHLAYWRAQLAGPLPTLELPTDRPRLPVASFRGARHRFALPHALSEGLRAFSQRAGVTLFMTLLAAFQVLLARYSGQHDIAVGTPIANRTHSELERLIGFFANTLVLRCDLAGNPSFTALLARVREVCIAAYTHQDMPFELLVEALAPIRDLSRNPLFQVMFLLQQAPTAASQQTSLHSVDVETGTTQFDLTLSLAESAQGLSGTVQYAVDLFSAATIARLVGHLQVLLEAALAYPELRLAELPLLSAAERHELLVAWNATQRAYPTERCIHELVEAQTVRTPDAIAVVFEDQRLTYRELDEQADQLGWRLGACGIGNGCFVAVLMDRSIELVIAFLSIMRAGAAFVPLDTTWPRERLTQVLDELNGAVVVINRTTPQRDADLGRSCLIVDERMCAATAPRRRGTVASSAPLYTIYTSGSTGKPKGVIVPHRGITNRFFWMDEFLGRATAAAVLQTTRPVYDSAVWQLFWPLINGGKTVLPSAGRESDARYLSKLIEREAVTITDFVPSVFTSIVPQLLGDSQVRERLKSLRVVIVGGEEITPATTYTFQAQVAGVRILNLYGPTEASIGCICYEVTGKEGDKIPIGKPIANVGVLILDQQGGLVPVGVAGELYLSGSCLGNGYLHQPDLTAERFVPNSFAEVLGVEGWMLGDRTPPQSSVLSPQSSSRLYRTGDLARYRSDGNIEFVGRIDDQVKVRGYRIEPGEIEAALHQHPAVRECAVIAREDTPGEKRLVAYVVPTTDHRPPTNDQQADQSSFVVRHSSFVSELRRFLAQTLPSYMTPSAFVLLEALPLMSSGKVNRRALLPPDAVVVRAKALYVAPRDRLELRLVQLWEEVLALHPVSITDNFFALGGHSLLAVRLLAQIERLFDRRLPLAALFQDPTITQLAQRLRQQDDTTPWSPLVALQPGGTRRPFFCVHPVSGSVLCYLELARALGPDQPFYGLQAAGLEGEQPPLREVNAMAASYVTALRAVQAEGPYQLGGWSVGGVIALEMARQLRAQDQEIGLLALLDTVAPGAEQWRALATTEDAVILVGFVRDLAAQAGQVPDLSSEMIEQSAPEQQVQTVLAQAQALGVLPPDIGLTQIDERVAVFKANLTAVGSYVPAAASCRIVLFRASDSATAHAADPQLGWGTLAAGELEVVEVAGNHYTMVAQPHVQQLAERLQGYLRG